MIYYVYSLRNKDFSIKKKFNESGFGCWYKYSYLDGCDFTFSYDEALIISQQLPKERCIILTFHEMLETVGENENEWIIRDIIK